MGKQGYKHFFVIDKKKIVLETQFFFFSKNDF